MTKGQTHNSVFTLLQPSLRMLASIYKLVNLSVSGDNGGVIV